MPGPNVYLHFTGKCAEAMRFYEKTLGGRMTEFLTWGDSMPPDQVPPGMKDKIIHCSLEVDGGWIMASDGPAEYAAKMSGFSITLHYTDEKAARRMFDALVAGGKPTMPFAKTFFSPGFGMLEDRFGTPWMIDTLAENPAHG